MKTKIIFLLVLGLALAAGTVAWSQPFNGGPGGPSVHRPHCEEKVLMMLDLDDAQKTRIAETVARYRQRERDLIMQNRGMHREMADVLFAETFDETAVREAFRKNTAVHEELLVLKGRMISEIRTLLTPDQTSELKRNARKEHQGACPACGIQIPGRRRPGRRPVAAKAIHCSVPNGFAPCIAA